MYHIVLSPNLQMQFCIRDLKKTSFVPNIIIIIFTQKTHFIKNGVFSQYKYGAKSDSQNMFINSLSQ